MSNITVKKPSKEELAQLRIDSWDTWECEPSAFPWEYHDQETCYVFEGRVTIETEDGVLIHVEAGDLAIFPKGLQCRWTVHQKIRKVYKFG